MSRKIKSVSFTKVCKVADRISLLSIHAALSMSSQPCTALLKRTFTQIDTESRYLLARVDAWGNGTPLAQEILFAFETIYLLSSCAVTALPANPSSMLLERTFNRIHQVCSALVIRLDKVEGLA